MQVTLVCASAPRQVEELVLSLESGATVADAMRVSGWDRRFEEGPAGPGWGVSVWGRKASPEQVLREGDRVEFCRDLRVDPKVARRERFNKQGARTAGLFSRRRKGSKPGY